MTERQVKAIAELLSMLGTRKEFLGTIFGSGGWVYGELVEMMNSPVPQETQVAEVGPIFDGPGVIRTGGFSKVDELERRVAELERKANAPKTFGPPSKLTPRSQAWVGIDRDEVRPGNPNEIPKGPKA